METLARRVHYLQADMEKRTCPAHYRRGIAYLNADPRVLPSPVLIPSNIATRSFHRLINALNEYSRMRHNYARRYLRAHSWRMLPNLVSTSSCQSGINVMTASRCLHCHIIPSGVNIRHLLDNRRYCNVQARVTQEVELMILETCLRVIKSSPLQCSSFRDG